MKRPTTATIIVDEPLIEQNILTRGYSYLTAAGKIGELPSELFASCAADVCKGVVSFVVVVASVVVVVVVVFSTSVTSCVVISSVVVALKKI